MAQFNAGEVFTDVSPGKTVSSTRLNNHVNGGTLLNGAILDQTEKVITVGADYVFLGDSTLAATGIPKKVQLTNLLPEIIRQGTQQYVVSDTGTASAYVVALTPAATGYTAGMVVRFKAGNASTGASTVNVNALGAKNIFTRAGAALAANDILASQVVEVVYDGTQFQLVAGISAGEITATHAAENLRTGENQYAAGAGTANVQTVSITPAPTAITAGLVVRFKASVANTAAMTLNVNALGGVAVNRVVAGAAVALLANDIQVADLVTVVYDGTQFQIAGRVRSWDFVGEAAGTLVTTDTAFAPTLGAIPTKIRVVLRCVASSVDTGFSINDELNIEGCTRGADQQPNFAVVAQAASTWAVVVRTFSATPRVTSAAGTTLLTATNWKYKLYASL